MGKAFQMLRLNEFFNFQTNMIICFWPSRFENDFIAKDMTFLQITLRFGSLGSTFPLAVRSSSNSSLVCVLDPWRILSVGHPSLRFLMQEHCLRVARILRMRRDVLMSDVYLMAMCSMVVGFVDAPCIAWHMWCVVHLVII